MKNIVPIAIGLGILYAVFGGKKEPEVIVIDTAAPKPDKPITMPTGGVPSSTFAQPNPSQPVTSR